MAYLVRLSGTNQHFEVAKGETILSGALRTDVTLAHDCQCGGCGTCRIRVLEGSVSYAELPLALTEQERNERYALACQALPQSDLIIEPARALEDLPQPMKRTATVDKINALTPSVTQLILKIQDAAQLEFRPGQYLNILMPEVGTRSFSMASKPKGNLVDFHIRRLQGGRFSDERLVSLRLGEELEVEVPLGSFYFRREDYRPLIMVATGTGLAPIKAMLDSLHGDPDCPPVALYWGTRTAADLYWDNEIAAWKEHLYEFQYVPVLSRADAGWHGRRGYVQDSVIADFRDLSEHAIYLCGSPEMIHSAKQAFIAHGAALQHIYTEGFVHRASR